MDVQQETDTIFAFILSTPLAFLYVPAVSSIAANIFVSFVIVRYDKLRKEVANILLLHINIVEMLFLFSITISTKIFATLHLSSNSTVPCVTCEVEFALVLCLFFLLILSTTDWYIKTYSEHNHPKFRCIYNYFVGAIYVLTIVVASYASHFCIDHSHHLYAYNFVIVIGFSLVVCAFVIVMNIVHIVKRSIDTVREDNIGLAMINIFMLAWTTVYLALLSIIFGHYSGLVMVVLLVFVAAVTCLAIPIFHLIYLWRCNFKVFLDKALSGDCRNETLADPSVVYAQCDASGVPV